MTFTTENKKTVDILGTIAIMVAVFYFFYKKKTEKKQLAAYTALSGVLGYIAIGQLTNALVDASNRPEHLEGVTDPSVNANWDPTPTTDALHDQTYQSWWDNFQGNNNLDAYQNALNLGNDGLLKVYNDWTDRYWGEYNETLTAALQNDSIYYAVGNGSDAILLRDSLIDRLTQLGMN